MINIFYERFVDVFKKFLIVLSFFSVTSFTTHAEEAQPSTPPPLTDMFAACAKMTDLNKTLAGYGFKPIFVSTAANQNLSMYVWVNFKQDITQYVLSNGERGCVVYRGDRTLFNVPSGLTSL